MTDATRLLDRPARAGPCRLRTRRGQPQAARRLGESERTVPGWLRAAREEGRRRGQAARPRPDARGRPSGGAGRLVAERNDAILAEYAERLAGARAAWRADLAGIDPDQRLRRRSLRRWGRHGRQRAVGPSERRLPWPGARSRRSAGQVGSRPRPCVGPATVRRCHRRGPWLRNVARSALAPSEASRSTRAGRPARSGSRSAPSRSSTPRSHVASTSPGRRSREAPAAERVQLQADQAAPPLQGHRVEQHVIDAEPPADAAAVSQTFVVVQEIAVRRGRASPRTPRSPPGGATSGRARRRSRPRPPRRARTSDARPAPRNLSSRPDGRRRPRRPRA